jgi:hypothetical protein
MACSGVPDGISDGLVLALDAANKVSYPGTGTSWYDLSNNVYIGTLTNGPTFNGANGGSIVFDGVDDYVSVSSAQSLNPGTNSFTIDYWCKINSSNYSCALEARGTNLHGFLAIAYYLGGYISLLLNGTNDVGQNVYLSTTTPVQFNVWNYQTIVVDRSTQQIIFYYNGYQTGNRVNITDTGTIDPGSGYRYWIGGDLGGAPMNGNIPILRQYNRALTAAEILQNYNDTKTRFGILS